MAFFSIIIPAYNAEAYIARALDSALGQSERDLEVIVVDDGSFDRTAEVAQGYADRDVRVRVIRHPGNSGAGHARNLGIERARGDWIAMLDADDWFDADRLRRLAEAADAAGADIVSDDQYWIHDGHERPFGTLLDRNGNGFAAEEPGGRAITPADLLRGDRPGGPRNLGLLKPMVRRRWMEGRGIRYAELRSGEDFYFLLECCLEASTVLLVDAPLYFYTVRNGSLSRSATAEDYRAASVFNGRFIERRRAACPDPTMTLLVKRGVAQARYARYRRVADPAKRGEWSRAVGQLCRNFDTLPLFIRGLGRRAKALLRARLRPKVSA